MKKVEEAALGLNTGVVIVDTVGLVATAIHPTVTIAPTTWTVTETLYFSFWEHEGIAVCHAVYCLQGVVGYLHIPGMLRCIFFQKSVTQCLPQAYLPPQGGEVSLKTPSPSPSSTFFH